MDNVLPQVLDDEFYRELSLLYEKRLFKLNEQWSDCYGELLERTSTCIDSCMECLELAQEQILDAEKSDLKIDELNRELEDMREQINKCNRDEYASLLGRTIILAKEGKNRNQIAALIGKSNTFVNNMCQKFGINTVGANKSVQSSTIKTDEQVEMSLEG